MFGVVPIELQPKQVKWEILSEEELQYLKETYPWIRISEPLEIEEVKESPLPGRKKEIQILNILSDTSQFIWRGVLLSVIGIIVLKILVKKVGN